MQKTPQIAHNAPEQAPACIESPGKNDASVGKESTQGKAAKLNPHTPEEQRKFTERTMHLPAGYSCGECGHFLRCAALFGCKTNNVTCDWNPSRFALPIPPKE